MKQLETTCSIERCAAWLIHCTAVYLKMWPQQMREVSVYSQQTLSSGLPWTTGLPSWICAGRRRKTLMSALSAHTQTHESTMSQLHNYIRMYMHTWTHTHKLPTPHTCANKHIRTHEYLYTSTHTRTDARTHGRTYMCTCAHAHAHTCANKHMRTHEYLHTSTHARTHTCTHTCTHRERELSSYLQTH